MTKIQKSILKFLAGNQATAVSAKTIGGSVGAVGPNQVYKVVDALDVLRASGLVLVLVEKLPHQVAGPPLYSISMTGLDYVRSKDLS